MRFALAIFRIVYGAWFLFWGASSLTMRLWGVGVETPKSEGEAQALMDIVNASFMGPVSAVGFVVSGLLMIRDRTSPLGIAILAPFVTYIFFYHVLLSGDVVWGSLWAAGWALLAWWYRDAFRPLVGLDRKPA